MRRLAPILTLAVALAAASTALTEPQRRAAAPLKTTQCIEVDGRIIPPVCHAPASHIEGHEYICLCSNGGMQVETPVCAKGQTPPPENLALYKARREAGRDGSLLGDKVGDRAICVAPRNGDG